MEKQTFQFTIETPNDFIGGDVFTSDLEKAEEFCVESLINRFFDPIIDDFRILHKPMTV